MSARSPVRLAESRPGGSNAGHETRRWSPSIWGPAAAASRCSPGPATDRRSTSSTASRTSPSRPPTVRSAGRSTRSSPASLTGLRSAADRAPAPIASLAVDGWGVDYVRLGSDGLTPLADPYCYRRRPHRRRPRARRGGHPVRRDRRRPAPPQHALPTGGRPTGRPPAVGAAARVPHDAARRPPRRRAHQRHPHRPGRARRPLGHVALRRPRLGPAAAPRRWSRPAPSSAA